VTAGEDDVVVVDDPASSAAPTTGWAYRVGQSGRRGMWSAAVLIGGLALLATFTNGRGSYVPDVSFELYRNPWRILQDNLHIWSPTPGMGRVLDGAIVGPPLATGLLHALGLSMATAERVWHAALLTAAGLGAIALLRCFRPGLTRAHVVAGLVYAFNPVTAVWLVPTTLFLPYALVPWFLLFMIRAARGGDVGRWAGAAALGVFLTGSNNPPSLLYALAPLAPTALYLVWIERSTSIRRLLTWGALTAVLAVAASAAWILLLPYSFSELVGLIAQTENPKFVNVASSWAESVRGLGQWVAYGRDGPIPWLPHRVAYLTNPAVVAATFAAPIAALVVLWRSKWGPRLLFGMFVVLGTFLMVGAHPVDDPSPMGRALLHAYDRLPGASALRNSYKAAPSLALGLAVLVGVCVEGLPARPHQRRRGLTGVSLLVVGLIVSAFPFWTGRLYHPDQRLTGVPAYWTDALSWLDEQQGDGRVLFVPGSQAMGYRWGDPGTDIFHALLRREYVQRTWFAAGTAQAANLLNAFDDRFQTGHYEPGSIAPIARRLGIRWIVIRNDIDWEATHVARPAMLKALREDPDLRRVISFGEPGENVVQPGDKTLNLLVESQIRPVEVFGVPASADPVRAEPAPGPLLVSGDGGAVPLLARDGFLDGRGAVPTGALDDPTFARLLRAPGAELVVTDSNRRRLRTERGPVDHDSYTLAAGQSIDGHAPSELFTADGAESVATYRDARDITASSYGTPLAGEQPWLRPANAFDHDPATSWSVGALGDPTGEWLRVHLRRARPVHRITLTGPAAENVRRVARVRVALSDGTTRVANVRSGTATVDFGGRRTRAITITIDAVTGPGTNAVGFTDVDVAGFDLRERIRLPVDAVRRAVRPAVRKTAARATVAYQFERSILSRDQPEERRLSRRFSTFDRRSYVTGGRHRLDVDTPARRADQAVAGPLGAAGATSPFFGDPHNNGLSAVDGRPETAWRAQPLSGEKLTLRMAPRVVGAVVIRSQPSTDASRILSVRVRVGAGPASTDQVVSADVGADGVTVQVTPVGATHVSIEVTGAEPRTSVFGTAPVVISEVELNGVPNPPDTITDATPLPGCVRVGTLDESPLYGRIKATLGELYSGAPVEFEGCGAPVLAAGSHRFEAADDFTLDDVRLTGEGTPRAGSVSVVTSRLLHRNATSAQLRVRSGGQALIVTGTGYDRRWRASIDGVDLGKPIPVDGTTAWLVSKRGTFDVDITFAPQSVHRAALAISAIGVLACLVLVIRPRRAR
jgi:arabinofuranan 3-O-arabinosyltransferase